MVRPQQQREYLRPTISPSDTAGEGAAFGWDGGPTGSASCWRPALAEQLNLAPQRSRPECNRRVRYAQCRLGLGARSAAGQ
jgi:hypothetical protein